jgi:hypothetical protein
MASYTVKISPAFAEVGSAQVQAWLHGLSFGSGAFRIAADPGAGDRILRLSLPADQVNTLAAKLGDPPAVALRRLIATHVSTARAQVVPDRSSSTAPDPWFSRHPILALLLILAGIAGLLWLLFRRNGGPPTVPGSSAAPLLVSGWSPLQ